MVAVLCKPSYAAYGNTCMIFYEHILNGFKVVERTWFCHRNCYLQSSKGRHSKSINTKVMVLACRLMLVNICDILNGFKVIERTWFCHRTAKYKLQRDVTKKYIFKSYGPCTPHVVFWCLIFVWSFINILDSSKVIERTRFCQETVT